MAPRHVALVLDQNLALPVVRSLGPAGWRVLAPQGSRLARSRWVSGTVPPLDPRRDDFADEVAVVCERNGVDVVVPADDHTLEVLGTHRHRLAGAKLLGASDDQSLRLAVDKQACAAAADAVGFPTPQWYAPGSLADVAEAVSAVGLPCVVKPRQSFTSTGTGAVKRRHRFLERMEDLEPVVSALAQSDGTLPVIQEYVPGRSLALSAVVHGGRVVAWMAREAFSHLPVGGGVPVHKRTISPDDDGVQAAVQLLADVGYSGLVNVEYQVGTDHKPRLMEFSGRTHVSVPLAMAAGLDLPLIAARALVDGEVPDAPPPYRAGVDLRWPRGELERIVAALDFREPATTKWQPPPGVSRLRALSRAWPPWRPGMRYDNIDRRDLAPFMPQALFRLWNRRSAADADEVPVDQV